MDDDTRIRIAHATINGASFNHIGEVFEITASEARAAWELFASEVPRAPCNYKNMREVQHFAKEWREAVYKYIELGK